jgi:23S rRNA (cytidine1920-2'-O)/16S rRNA (cytidine1409-2'-O)-methyltransferase
VARRTRLDTELVRRGLARSREQAAQLVSDGLVSVAGQVAAKPADQVDRSAPIVLAKTRPGPDYASRGGHKLAGALDGSTSRPAGQWPPLLGAGASTGGSPTCCCGAARHM